MATSRVDPRCSILSAAEADGFVETEVVPSLAGIRWDPNSPAAVLIVTDDGLASLALSPQACDAMIMPVCQ
jgi:hypothetical protein